jgi:diguanylate cyclase (GGDEF)-like protein
MQKLLAGYSIKSADDLLYFLTAQVNRLEKAENKNFTNAQEKLIKTVLKTVKQLHSQKAAKLADTVLKTDLKFPKNLDSATDWFREFNESYSHAFLNELDHFGRFTKTDLATLIGEIIKELGSKESIRTADDLVRLLILALTPSISSSISDTVARLEEQLKNSPELITAKAVQEEITQCIIRRIRDDNEIFNAKLQGANIVIDSLLEKIADMISTSEAKCDDVNKIKEELKAIDFNNGAQNVQSRLIDISDMIDQSITAFSRSLGDDRSEIEVLKSRIVALEQELVEAQREASEDYLTSTLTRRGLAKKMELFENDFIQNGHDYAVVFFDVDHFKMINDTYGHNAGDVILASIGKFMNDLADEGDIVGRYGGEEFVLLTHKNHYPEVFRFADGIREKVGHTLFLYQKKEITVSCSAGIALRSAHDSQTQCIKAADKMVYEAKAAGRNTVFPRP